MATAKEREEFIARFVAEYNGRSVGAPEHPHDYTRELESNPYYYKLRVVIRRPAHK